MPDLTFGEQVKIVLGRKGMTIKELAEMIEQRTDKKMSRQNLTQRLGRDNFQEQDMRMIASILECPFRLSILGEDTLDEREIGDTEAGFVIEAAVLNAGDEEDIRAAALSAASEGEEALEDGGIADGGEREGKGIGERAPEAEAAGESSAETGSESAAGASGENAALAKEENSAGASAENAALAKEESAGTEASEESGAEAAIESAAGASAENAALDKEESARTENYSEGESPGREITVGEFLEIRKSSGESAQEQLMQELLAEMDSIEREDRERSIAIEERRRIRREQQEAEKKVEKKGGWMSRFRFRKHEEQSEPEEYFDETDIVPEAEDADAGTDADGTETAGEDGGQEKSSEPATFSDRIKEYTGPDDELRDELYEDEEEDLEAGDVNPYTGREYFSNSVRMHPKRIGYVQVYNRRDHKWTDMTEWAFLGYQERKKMLLGKDYEPPIYLD